VLIAFFAKTFLLAITFMFLNPFLCMLIGFVHELGMGKFNLVKETRPFLDLAPVMMEPVQVAVVEEFMHLWKHLCVEKIPIDGIT
jgi:hypothetical protein